MLGYMVRRKFGLDVLVFGCEMRDQNCATEIPDGKLTIKRLWAIGSIAPCCPGSLARRIHICNSCTYIYIYIYIYMYNSYVCIYTYVCTWRYIYIYMNTYIYICIYLLCTHLFSNMSSKPCLEAYSPGMMRV